MLEELGTGTDELLGGRATLDELGTADELDRATELLLGRRALLLLDCLIAELLLTSLSMPDMFVLINSSVHSQVHILPNSPYIRISIFSIWQVLFELPGHDFTKLSVGDEHAFSGKSAPSSKRKQLIMLESGFLYPKTQALYPALWPDSETPLLPLPSPPSSDEQEKANAKANEMLANFDIFLQICTMKM